MKYFQYCILCLYIFSCNQSPPPKTQEIDNNQFIEPKKLTFDLTLEELMQINVVKDSLQPEYEPTYDLSIEDLMALKIVKSLDVDTQITVSYDIPLEELMKVHIPIQQKEAQISPTYEMTLKGLAEFSFQNNYNVSNNIELSYDISLDGLMKIKIKDLE